MNPHSTSAATGFVSWTKPSLAVAVGQLILDASAPEPGLGNAGVNKLLGEAIRGIRTARVVPGFNSRSPARVDVNIDADRDLRRSRVDPGDRLHEVEGIWYH